MFIFIFTKWYCEMLKKAKKDVLNIFTQSPKKIHIGFFIFKEAANKRKRENSVYASN